MQSTGDLRLAVFAVNFKESQATVQSFVQQNDLSLPVLRDAQGELARQWELRVFPSTVVVGRDGRARYLVQGEFDWSGPQAKALLAPLLRRN